MSEPVDTLVKRKNSIKTKRQAILPFWQELAEQFHPFRAQFTRQTYLSEQFTDIQLTSYPMIVARELQNTFAAMLRPRDQEWFRTTIERKERLDKRGKAWLEYATSVQRRAMYDRHAMFTRATKEGDQDFAIFGQAALTRETDHENLRMLYRTWHLKDTFWGEGADGAICEIYREWRPTASNLKKKFPRTYSKKIDNWIAQDPFRELECLHVVIPGEDYDPVLMPGQSKKFRTPWVSIYLDVENNEVLEEVGSFSRIYTIPRWQTVSGSQWAYSPAAVAGLPDARLLQAMTLTLMEAGEVSVRPPIIATQEAVRSDVALYSGGITWVDAEYDERLGEALRPLVLTQGSGLTAGAEMMKDAREKLAEAFYLNKLGLPAPDQSREMTAYETGQRIQEWIRQALPLFEPVEAEYNAAICEDTFEALMREGAFGPYRDIPASIRGQQVRFEFESPLHQATERKKGALLLQAAQLLEQAAQLDPNVAAELDAATALRDALEGIGVPATWLRDPDEVAQLVAAKQQQDQTALRTQQIANAGQAAESLGRAAQSFQGAQAA